ncbi:hypothetical protein BT93_B2303 [Corymbia citriodora subsp. variegata]|nr:hypothetical protein BT93_B2303 [Corymbia citriodora subsp. variegata]
MAYNIPQLSMGSNGKSIPLLGFGTAEYPLGNTKNLKEIVLRAIELGYRHFDTAAVYQSEKPLGEAIAEALKLGLVKSRDNLFITSKLWCNDAHRERVIPALRNSLRNLQLEYLDLYLLHWPMTLRPEAEILPKEEDLLPFEMESVWEGMEECVKLGLAKCIGVCNFSCKKLDKLLATAKIPPAVDQVEMNPVWQQKKLREFCMEKGVHVSAYSPLGGRGTAWGSNRVMDCEVLHQIATARGKTIAQVCLRWAYEQGVSVIMKSFNHERMEQNLRIFDWSLSPEELQKISQIPQVRGCTLLGFISDKGPYKSIEEFWDCEI